MSVLTWDETKKIAIAAIFEHFGEHLKDSEINILEDAWLGRSYREMADKYHLSLNYLRGDLGPKLWNKLSLALGEEVSKKNFKQAIERRNTQPENSAINQNISSSSFHEILKKGSLSPDSVLYMERREIDSFCQQILYQPKTFLQIKSPRYMGKTSLIFKLLKQMEAENNPTLYLDLKGVETNIINDISTFLDWFCCQVSQFLGLDNSVLNNKNSNILSYCDRCTLYFEQYLLVTLESPLILAIDNLDCLFSHPVILQDFLGMIHLWQEKNKRQKLWQKIQIVMAYSTDNRYFLDFDVSLHDRFDIGISIELTDFDASFLDRLLSLCHFQWSDSEKKTLWNMMGGHPYLISLALSEILRGNLTLEQLIAKAPTSTGIYVQYLQRYLKILRFFPELEAAFAKLIHSNQPVSLDLLQIEQLSYMGLIQIQENGVIPKYPLYREFFRRYLKNRT